MVDGKGVQETLTGKSEEKAETVILPLEVPITLKSELADSKEEVKRLSRELESLKKKVSKSELVGLKEFLRTLYKQSDDVHLRQKLLSWLKQL